MPVGRSEVLHYLSFFNSSLGPLQYLGGRRGWTGGRRQFIPSMLTL
jgi:hypothetical protein